MWQVASGLTLALGGSSAAALVLFWRRRQRSRREELFRAAFDGSSEFMALLDEGGRLLAANPTALALAGDKRGGGAGVEETFSFRGCFFWDAPWWAHSATLRAEIRAAVAAVVGGRGAGEVARVEAVLPDPDGTTRYFDLSLGLAPGEPARRKGALVIAEGWDVTRLRKAEHDTAALAERLHRRELLGAAGRLAGGVAHDFNNLLAAIVGSLEVLRTDSTLGPRGQEALSIIRQSAETAAHLTVQLLAFGRPRAPGPWVVDPAAALGRIELLLRHALGPDPRLALEVKSAPDPWPIRLDSEQLEQILVNLALNARDAMAPDAMPDGGKLVVELSNITLTAPRTFQTMEAEAGEYLQILVRDTGVGMRDAVLDRIFEPFFTTKEVGKGTGLGLSVVYGIVRQSGGYIEVRSRPGAGTEMRLLFPRARMLPAAARAAEPLPPAAAGEHIVLVEDQPAMRASARDFLESLGYEVDAYPDGESALAAARALAAPDLLITDVALPGCSGLEVADRLRSRWPSLEVLLLSGHGEPEGGPDESVPNTHFVPRPLSASMLAERVRAILGTRGVPAPAT